MILILVAGGVVLLIMQSGSKEPGSSRAAASANGPNGTNGNGNAAHLNKMKRELRGAIDEITKSVTALMNDVSSYDDRLGAHRQKISAAETLQTIKEIEAKLLNELDQMRSLNDTYRTQLDQARETIHNQQNQLEVARHEAGEDALTRVPNRRLLDARMAEDVSRAERQGNELSMLLIDLDDFKRLNDEHGHQAGDGVLRGVAHVWNRMRRQHEFLARYGGEEFCMLLPNTTLQQGRLVAERVRKETETAVFKSGANKIKLTCSVGVSTYRPGSDTVDSFVARCDEALYRAKSKGRNRVEVEDP